MMASYSPAAYPADEPERQAAVERSGVLARPADAGLQRVVNLAAQYFRTPIAAITIIDRARQWVAARHGIDVEETTRDVSFCAHALHRPAEMLVIRDAAVDRRFACHPFVLDEPHIRFYAGAPLLSRNGYALGALCIVDTEPRLGDIDLFELSLLAREAEALINR
jgi:GAF domain-containing protein